jgi:hypothetical protein
VDFIATQTVPTAGLKAALEKDEVLLPTITLCSIDLALISKLM